MLRSRWIPISRTGGYSFARRASLLFAVSALAVAVGNAREVSAQVLTGSEAKCVEAHGKGGAKLSKTQGKLQLKCVKDASKGKLLTTTDACIDDDEKGKVERAEQKIVDRDAKSCGAGSGYVSLSATQTILSGRYEQLELLYDLVGTDVEAAVEFDKNPAKCQQRILKSADKVVSTTFKSFLKCTKLAADAATDLTGFENCLTGVIDDSKVAKAITKLDGSVAKFCGVQPIDTIFDGDCSISDPVLFSECVQAAAKCRSCTSIAGIHGLAVDCDLLDNEIDDDSCADLAPACGDGTIDPGEECDPGSEPICCNADCTNVANGTSCDDGAFCTGTDTCTGGVCNSTGDPCTGGAECNNECNEAADNCFNTSATVCTDDGNVCTDDICDGAGGCAHPNNTDPCDDSDACTTVDVCGGGTCNGSVPPDCTDGNVCTDDVCVPATGCTNPPNTDPCNDGLFCTAVDTCDGAGVCVGAGDPCSGGNSCNSQCNEGPATCFQTAGTTCGFDAGGPGPEDACDVSADTCDGAGTCVNGDPAEGPELCYVAGDEDCDGNADTADTDSNSICQTNGTETCTCADACTVGQLVPVLGISTSLGAVAPWSTNSIGSVTATHSGFYGGTTGHTSSYAFAGVPANLDLWWGVTNNGPHNADFGGAGVTQFRFTASEGDAKSGPDGDQVSEGPGPGASQSYGATTAAFGRTDGLSVAFGSCSTSTALSLEMSDGGGGAGWDQFGTPFPISSLTPPSLATSAATNLPDTGLLEISSNSLDVDVHLRLGPSDIDSVFDACNTTVDPNGYGVNFTGAIYGTYRNVNICP